MRLVTWNINSVRLRLALLQRVLTTLDADLVCLQEIKVETEAFPARSDRRHGLSPSGGTGVQGL